MSKIAFIFPGQGAQTTGMGQDFYQETETGRGMFEKASEILGFSMTDLCFDPAQTDRLNITEYTQPAMVTASLAMMRVFMERTFLFHFQALYFSTHTCTSFINFFIEI